MLLTGLAVAVPAVPVAVRYPVVAGVLFALTIPPLVSALLIANVINRRRTRALELVPEASAFATPRLGSGVLFALSLLFMIAALTAVALMLIIEGEDRWQWAAGLVVLLGLGAVTAGPAWRGCGVQLHATGLRYDGPACTTVIAWEALDPTCQVETVDRFAIGLRYARPDLVRFTGIAFNRRRLQFEGVDAHHLAAVIAYYAAHPEQRVAIGTVAEHDRLGGVVDDHAPAAEDSPGWIGIGVAALVLGGAIAVALSPVPHWIRLFAYVVAYRALGYAVPGVRARLRRKVPQP